MTEPQARRRTRANGEGGIREDKTRGRWVANVTIGWDEVPDGQGGTRRRQVRKYVVGKTKREVAERLRGLQAMADRGIPVPDQQVTVGVMLDQWLRDVLPGTVALATEGQYQDVVRLYIKPRLGDKRLRDLTPTDVTRMLRDMESRRRVVRRGTARTLAALRGRSFGERSDGRKWKEL